MEKLKKFWKLIKSKQFLYALLIALLLYAFAIGSAKFWQWLIPWRLGEIIIWFVVCGIVYYKTIMWGVK